jgi:large subunit ribosomal protein L31
MRKDIHPAYQQVLFHDTNADVYFLIGSTIQTKQTKEYQGQVYPYVTLDISSAYILSIQVKYVKQVMKGVLQALTNASLALIVRVNLTLSFNQYT